MDCGRDARRCSGITHILARSQGVVAERPGGVQRWCFSEGSFVACAMAEDSPIQPPTLDREWVETTYLEELEINLPV